MLINVADVLDDELTDDRLKGLLAFDTVLGARLGPRSPNSLLLLLNRLAGEAAAAVAAARAAWAPWLPRWRKPAGRWA